MEGDRKTGRQPGDIRRQPLDGTRYNLLNFRVPGKGPSERRRDLRRPCAGRLRGPPHGVKRPPSPLSARRRHPSARREDLSSAFRGKTHPILLYVQLCRNRSCECPKILRGFSIGLASSDVKQIQADSGRYARLHGEATPGTRSRSSSSPWAARAARKLPHQWLRADHEQCRP